MISAAALSSQLSDSEIYRLIGLLSHSSVKVRLEAIQALSKLKHPSIVAAVARRTNDASEEIRQLACRALGHWQAREQRGRLYDSLVDSDFHVRLAAAEALAEMGDRSGVVVAADGLSAKGPQRWAALRSLNRITGQSFEITPEGLRGARRWIRYRKKLQ